MRKFFKAQTISEALQYAQMPNYTKLFVTNYYKNYSYAKFDKINLLFDSITNSFENNSKSVTFRILKNGKDKSGIPVSLDVPVDKTGKAILDKIKIDWVALLEFKQNLLGKFTRQMPVPTNTFRVILSKEPIRNLKNQNRLLAKMEAYRLLIPIKNHKGFSAYVSRKSPLIKLLKTKLNKNKFIFATVELKIEKEKVKNIPYIKIINIPTFSWSLKASVKEMENLIVLDVDQKKLSNNLAKMKHFNDQKKYKDSLGRKKINTNTITVRKARNSGNLKNQKEHSVKSNLPQNSNKFNNHKAHVIDKAVKNLPIHFQKYIKDNNVVIEDSVKTYNFSNSQSTEPIVVKPLP